MGAVCTHLEALLLVRRGRGAAQGQWSVPGGHVEWGETLHEAVVREMYEETGLEVVVDRFLGWVERIDDPYHYVILDFAVTALDPSQTPVAGDDAAEVAWVPFADVSDLRARRRALRVPARRGSVVTRWTSTSPPRKRRSAPSCARSSTTSCPTWWKTVFVDDERAMPFTREFCHTARGARLAHAELAGRARRRRRLGVAAGRRARGDVGRGRATRTAVHEPQLHRPADHALRHARAAGPPPAAHGRGRRALVPGLLRARGGLRPRVAQDPRRARRRPLRRERSEDLEQLRRRARRPLPAARAHQHRGEEAGRASRCSWSTCARPASPCARSRAWRARASSARSSSTTPSSRSPIASATRTPGGRWWGRGSRSSASASPGTHAPTACSSTSCSTRVRRWSTAARWPTIPRCGRAWPRWRRASRRPSC